MKFAHLGDCHIGGWREPKLSFIAAKAFEKAISIAIEKNLDFVLITGDLFNTSLPGIDNLKVVVKKLKELKDRGIQAYAVAGSHDFSPSGRTIIDVLEHAGLLINVFKGSAENNILKLNFTVDKKTGAKITGIVGRKGMLERNYYENLEKSSLEQEPGYKIFMFHTALSELKPADMDRMDSAPLSYLPKNFSYYAGGHVHEVINVEEKGYGRIVYPGALFPANFRELEKFGNGGFFIVDNGKAEWQPVQVNNVLSIKINCSLKNPQEIEQELFEDIKHKEFFSTIVTIRLYGKLREGMVSDIDFRQIYERIYAKGAYFVMKNTSGLESKEFQAVKIGSPEEIESKLIEENINQIKIGQDEKKLIHELMHLLNKEKEEDEKSADFEKRVIEDTLKVLDIKKKAL
jgi:DNA repair exonuclease SbcCD nuclease subunit